MSSKADLLREILPIADKLQGFGTKFYEMYLFLEEEYDAIPKHTAKAMKSDDFFKEAADIFGKAVR